VVVTSSKKLTEGRNKNKVNMMFHFTEICRYIMSHIICTLYLMMTQLPTACVTDKGKDRL